MLSNKDFDYLWDVIGSRKLSEVKNTIELVQSKNEELTLEELINSCLKAEPVLFWASFRQENTEVLQWLLDNGANLYKRSNEYMTALCEAVSFGSFEACVLLLEQGIDIEMHARDKHTPLHYAAYQGRPDICELLIMLEANIEAELAPWNTDYRGFNFTGLRPIHLAIMNHQPDVCEVLIRNKVDLYAEPISTEQPPLLMAVQVSDMHIIKLLIKHGVSINSSNSTGLGALHIAALSNDCAIAKWLLMNGADVNAQDNDGNTALHISGYKDFTEMNSLLMAHGADSNIPNSEGVFPLGSGLNRITSSFIQDQINKGNMENPDSEDFDEIEDLANGFDLFNF